MCVFEKFLGQFLPMYFANVERAPMPNATQYLKNGLVLNNPHCNQHELNLPSFAQNTKEMPIEK